MQLASHAYDIDICVGLNYKLVIFVGFYRRFETREELSENAYPRYIKLQLS